MVTESPGWMLDTLVVVGAVTVDDGDVSTFTRALLVPSDTYNVPPDIEVTVPTTEPVAPPPKPAKPPKPPVRPPPVWAAPPAVNRLARAAKLDPVVDEEEPSFFW